MLEQIQDLVEKLDNELILSLEEIFNRVCDEFGLDGATIAAALGCRCPYGLIGYLSESDD